MNFLTDDVKKLYKKYLFASMGSALVMSVYSFVDTIAVGQSEGTAGAAAFAVITPLYGTLIFLAILCGIGGSVLMSNAKGEGNDEKGNASFTAALIVMSVLVAAFWISFAMFHEQIFTFFGADETIMPKVMEYAQWIIWFFPVFTMPAFIGAFIRNDGAPTLEMIAVIVGGCVNVFGDWFLVFPLGMGMKGAAIATVLGTSIQCLIMSSHFFGRNCKLRLVKPHHVWRNTGKILAIGLSAGVLELGNVVIAIMMNNQIRRYGRLEELAVYGVVASVSALCQALLGGIGHAIQPIVSANYGAKNTERIIEFWKMSLATSVAFGVLFACIGEFFPVQLVRLFVDATPEVVLAAPLIVRLYYVIYPFLGITILATYYLQSLMCDKESLLIAILRSIAISSLFIAVFPLFLGIKGVWIALPCSELFVAVIALRMIRRKNRRGHR